MGDGRAPLGPMLREYIISEAMHALGIPGFVHGVMNTDNMTISGRDDRLVAPPEETVQNARLPYADFQKHHSGCGFSNN